MKTRKNLCLYFYNNFSELSLINNTEINKRIKISKELYEILLFSEQLNKISMGFYDVTVGLTVSKNGFGPQIDLNQTFIPKSIVRFKLLDRYYLIKYDNFIFDLSSIAKGYAVDKIHDLLLKKGIKNFLFDIGGELPESIALSILAQCHSVLHNRSGLALSGKFINS